MVQIFRSNGRTGAAAAGGLAAPSRLVNDVTPATPGAGRARATPIIVTVTGPPKSAPPISVHFFSAVNATCRDDDGKTCGGHCMPACVDMRAGADPTNCQPPPAGGRAAGHGRAPSAVHLAGRAHWPDPAPRCVNATAGHLPSITSNCTHASPCRVARPDTRARRFIDRASSDSQPH